MITLIRSIVRWIIFIPIWLLMAVGYILTVEKPEQEFEEWVKKHIMEHI